MTGVEQSKYLGILKEYWGYTQFRGIQWEIIESICSGKDTLGLMPTGGGKSVTFQVPALAMDGVCIVITPLIALMKDQVDHLRKKNVRAYAIYGTMQRNEILTILDNAVLGGVTLLYISPERLTSELFLTKLKHMHVSFITVDEAHCISQWGYDFRPSYLAIAKIRKMKPGIPVLALTATATQATINDIQEKLAFRKENVFRMSFERKNLAYIVRQTKDKLAETMKILNAVDGTAIIYTHNREKTKEYAEALASIGTTATFYHAGLDPVTRSDRQALWQEDKVKVMVATNAFGMGIDKPDVRVVIHVDCPDSIEEYFQEAGRAGRDGKKSYAVLLRGLHENTTLDKRIANNYPEKDYIKKVYEHVAYFLQVGVGSGYGYTFEFDMDKFCKYFKHFPLNVKPALSILQMAGYIEYSEEEVSFTRMQFLVDRDDLYRLKDMTENENNLVTTILRCYSGLFADLTRISEKLLSQKTGIEESQIYLILKGLSKRNIIKFIPKKNIPHIKYLQNRVVSEEIIIPKNVYEQRRKLFEMRINAMKYYIGNDKFCRNKSLLRYFGETKNEDCGHCDVCIRNKRNDKEQKTTYCNIRNKIIACLKDGKGHKVDEMRNIDPNYVELSHTLMKMLNDEEIINNDGSYFLNIKL